MLTEEAESNKVGKDEVDQHEIISELKNFEFCNKTEEETTKSDKAPYDWQAGKSTIKQRLSFMFNNEILSDVSFLVGKGTMTQKIPAHKFVLSIGSAVFHTMFNGANFQQQDIIEIPDVEPAAFLSLLLFLYTDEVQIGPETVMATLYAAKKYAVRAMESQCVEFLKSNLCSENAFMLLQQARLFDETNLAALCLDTIDKCTSEALNAEGFLDIDIDALNIVLERNTLRIKEIKLYDALLRWGDAQCKRQSLSPCPENLRQVLKTSVELIRFPLMTLEEFASGPAQTGILTDKEMIQIFLHLASSPPPNLKFLDTPRCCMTEREYSASRFLKCETRWGYSGNSDKIRFSVDKRIFVVGFGLYGSVNGSRKYGVKIQLTCSGTGSVLASNDTNFTSDGSTKSFKVMFKEPVEIAPATQYTAVATLQGPDSYYGSGGTKRLVVDCANKEKVTFYFSYNPGHNNGTSVDDGQIPEIIFFT